MFANRKPTALKHQNINFIDQNLVGVVIIYIFAPSKTSPSKYMYNYVFEQPGG